MAAAIRLSQQHSCSLDYLVGALPEKHGHVEAESRGSLEVDYQLELDRGLHRKLARLGTFEDAIRIARRAPIIVDHVISIRQQATELRAARLMRGAISLSSSNHLPAIV